jgi:hypothetical protein
VHLRLLRPANDVAGLEHITAARAVEERARAMLVAAVVTPDGVRLLYCEGDPPSSRGLLTARAR